MRDGVTEEQLRAMADRLDTIEGTTREAAVWAADFLRDLADVYESDIGCRLFHGRCHCQNDE